MATFPPQFPEVAPEVLASIIAFASGTADWLEADATVAATRGHDPKVHEPTIIGWRFVAEAFTEQQA